MRDMEEQVRAICRNEGLPCGSIEALQGGQVNQVFLVGGAYVVRIGEREDAYERLKNETELMQSLEGQFPAPRVLAFGQAEGRVYQVQTYVKGKKLYKVWKDLTPREQEGIAEQIGAALQVLHARSFAQFGIGRADARHYSTWADFIAAHLQETLEDIRHYRFQMEAGFVEMALEYIDAHKHVLAGGTPTLVHGDLTMVNILAEGGKMTALLDFEYALQAPADYELWTMEAFCLYPNDWAEEDNEVFCSADFASFIPLLRKSYPALFETPHLRERMNIYHLDAALSSHIAWRKSNLDRIPPESMAGKHFYMARITNFTFGHGARMFFV